MALLLDNPFRFLCPPGACSASIKSHYTSRAMPAALGVAEIEGEMPILLPSTLQSAGAIFALSPLQSIPSPFASSNNCNNHVSSLPSISMKYIIPFYHPTFGCIFLFAKIVSTFGSDKLHLFPSFISFVNAITSACVSCTCTFSLAIARISGLFTVQKRCHSRIPSWCIGSTQSSILSPIPPLMFFFCHSMCFNIKWTLGVMVHFRSVWPCTTASTYFC